ncbi:Sulfite exporter TauE/SafE [Corynebacterium ciconiae DSM 44920]|uniref:sulfite exporter TauE/SafE family protein n=1 Tax=Corynebacterium ciconiae TaxID=227319 RepID=UPI0003729636|nr:sulfite exporter TauE/SafE family protein [Corynebacterium ciconiae]WKD62115.1 Sulfite exporter TauE/SafE [Corynebacterium ciconiae DSM 44920]
MIIVTILVGIGVGLVVGALGAGGGILSVPALVYLLGFAPHDATTGSLIIVATTAAFSLISHARHGTVAWRRGGSFGLLAVVGSFLGGKVSVLVNPDVLMISFAGLLALVAGYMGVRGVRGRAQDHPAAPAGDTSRPWWLVLALACLTGFLTGFFGVGGGFIVVPVLVLALGMHMRLAAGTSLVIMIITAGAGLAARVGTEFGGDYLTVVVFTAASVVGGMLGEPLTRRVRPYQLTLAFATLLGVVAAATAVETALG